PPPSVRESLVWRERVEVFQIVSSSSSVQGTRKNHTVLAGWLSNNQPHPKHFPCVCTQFLALGASENRTPLETSCRKGKQKRST
ncbi:unnamed protein product, partial [Ectocarpus sp. 6 AP-2014]